MPPVVPLIAAAAAASAGWAGAAALVGGTITAASVAGGLMVAGAAMTAVGTLTGNKKLLKIGGIVGLAGGVTALAGNALSAAGQAAADAAIPEAVGEAAGEIAGSAAAETTNAAAAAASAPVEVAGSVLADGAPPIGASTPAGAEAAASTAPAKGLVEGAMGQPAATPDVVTNAAKPTGIVDASSAAGPASTVDASGIQAISPTEPTMMDKVSAIGKKGAAWLKDNKELVNTGAGMIQGAMKSYGDQAMVEERYKQQDKYEARQRQRISNSLQGLTMPVYKRPVTGAA